jgi:hypothetical protein
MSLFLPASLDPNTKRPPAERFKDANEVRELCEQMRTADRLRGQNRAKVQGLIDGNRPYPQGALVNAGQAWRANVNYREAEGLVQAQRTPYYDLVMEVSPCIDVTIDYGPNYKRQEWAKIIAEEFHRMLFAWHVQLRQSEELVHGWGTHLTMDAWDWRVSTKCMRDVLFPDETTSDLEDLEFFCVRDTVKAHNLYGSVRNPKIAAAMGWNPDAVEEAIIQASLEKSNRQGRREDDAEYVQQRLKNGDIGFGYNGAASLTLNHMFVREYGTKRSPGGVTHYITVENQASSKFLYKKRNRFKDFDQILHFFPYDIGSDGTVHSIRGLGVRIFPFCELFNRLKNHMVDNVLINSGILLAQQGNGVDMQRLQLTRLGPMNILPAGLTPAQWKPMDLSAGPIPLTRELQGTMQENTKSYRQNMSDNSVERTATEAAINNADQAKLAKSAHNMEYRQLGKLYGEQLRRASDPNLTTAHGGGKEAIAFQERCFKRGVPKAALAHVIEVRANHAMGAGSASQRIMVAETLLTKVLPLVGPQQKNNILNDYVAAYAGQNAPYRYVGEMGSDALPTDDDSVAVLENDALARGGEALVSPNQNHARHAGRHLQKAFSFVPALQQRQVPPEAVLMAWENIGPHVANHFGFIAQDPTQKKEAQAIKLKLDELSKMTDKLRQNLEEQAQAQEDEQALLMAGGGGEEGPPQPGGIDPNMAGLEKVRGELAIRMKQIEDEIARKGAESQHAMRLKDQAQQAKIALQAAGQEAKNRAYARPGSNGAPESAE